MASLLPFPASRSHRGQSSRWRYVANGLLFDSCRRLYVGALYSTVLWLFPVRERIGRRKLRKNSGCSWIEIKSRLNVFVAGDRSHPQSGKLQSSLETVRIRMKEKGYIPNKRYALLNGDDKEKEEALCGHSEKLAISFGILNSPPGRSIRVTKNLRVCGDCHEVAKFMSKMVEMEIVLRDSNHFHLFENGAVFVQWLLVNQLRLG